MVFSDKTERGILCTFLSKVSNVIPEGDFTATRPKNCAPFLNSMLIRGVGVGVGVGVGSGVGVATGEFIGRGVGW